MRGWSDSNVGNGPPELRGAFLENAGCESNGYFNSVFVGTCGAQLKVDVDLGSAATRIRLERRGPLQGRREDGSSACNYGNTCILTPVNPRRPVSRDTRRREPARRKMSR